MEVGRMERRRSLSGNFQTLLRVNPVPKVFPRMCVVGPSSITLVSFTWDARLGLLEGKENEWNGLFQRNLWRRKEFPNWPKNKNKKHTGWSILLSTPCQGSSYRVFLCFHVFNDPCVCVYVCVYVCVKKKVRAWLVGFILFCFFFFNYYYHKVISLTPLFIRRTFEEEH